MNTYSIYSNVDGTFTGSTIACPTQSLIDNIPDGCGCVVGEFDRHSKKVDVTSGLVVKHIPPQPSKNHVWNSEVERWLYVKTNADTASEVRLQRDKLLSACDWVTTRAVDYGEPIPSVWVEYRLSLRDITKQRGFPISVIWPQQP